MPRVTDMVERFDWPVANPIEDVLVMMRAAFDASLAMSVGDWRLAALISRTRVYAQPLFLDVGVRVGVQVAWYLSAPGVDHDPHIIGKIAATLCCHRFIASSRT